MTNKKLYRDEDEAILAGVCSGLADYFDVDVTLVRVIFLVLVIGGGSGLLIYIILWIVAPAKDNGVIVVDKEKNIKDFTDKVAKKTKVVAKEIKHEMKSSKRSGSFLGLILMAFGVLILLQKLIPMVIRWDCVWPVMLIFLGGYLVFRE